MGTLTSELLYHPKLQRCNLKLMGAILVLKPKLLCHPELRGWPLNENSEAPVEAPAVEAPVEAPAEEAPAEEAVEAPADEAPAEEARTYPTGEVERGGLVGYELDGEGNLELKPSTLRGSAHPPAKDGRWQRGQLQADSRPD